MLYVVYNQDIAKVSEKNSAFASQKVIFYRSLIVFPSQLDTTPRFHMQFASI